MSGIPLFVPDVLCWYRVLNNYRWILVYLCSFSHVRKRVHLYITCTLNCMLCYRSSACKTMCSIHCCSPGFKLFYPEDPLWMLRGEGQYLFDDQGIKYLDCVNNISHGMYTYICMYICVNRLYSRLIMFVLFNYCTKLFFHCTRMPLRLQSILCVYSFYNWFHHFYMWLILKYIYSCLCQLMEYSCM